MDLNLLVLFALRKEKMIKELQTRHDVRNRIGVGHSTDPGIGIFSETDRLKKVAVWGEPSVEAVMAQLYPTSKSLFLDDMDVFKAGEEARSYAKALRDHGVQVSVVRDELAKVIPGQHLQKDQLQAKLLRKADVIQKGSGISRPGYKDEIVGLLERDIEKYGEMSALAMAQVLCLDPSLPMGNIIYARDQRNVLMETAFRSRMSKNIRLPEVSIYDRVYGKLGYSSTVRMPFGETFEGGDGYIHDGIVYVGVGIRTTKGAAMHIYNTLQPQLETLGYRFAIVEDKIAQQRSEKEQMDFMHLDTFSMPTGKGQINVCEEEAKHRLVTEVVSYYGAPRLQETGKSFIDFLYSQGQDIGVVPLKEQQLFGCNFISIDGQTVLVPIESNKTIIGNLERQKKIVKIIDLSESTKGYGGPHCMTMQLERTRIMAA